MLSAEQVRSLNFMKDHDSELRKAYVEIFAMGYAERESLYRRSFMEWHQECREADIFVTQLWNEYFGKIDPYIDPPCSVYLVLLRFCPEDWRERYHVTLAQGLAYLWLCSCGNENNITPDMLAVAQTRRVKVHDAIVDAFADLDWVTEKMLRVFEEICYEHNVPVDRIKEIVVTSYNKRRELSDDT